MISITFEMILRAVIFSVLLGTSSSMLYVLGRSLINIIKSMLKKKGCHGSSSALLNVYDFFFVLAVGIVYITGNYTFCDKPFDLYSFIALFLTFFFTQAAIYKIILSFKVRKSR